MIFKSELRFSSVALVRVNVEGALGKALCKTKVLAPESPLPFTAATLRVRGVISPGLTSVKDIVITGSSEFPSVSKSGELTPSGNSQWYLVASVPCVAAIA